MSLKKDVPKKNTTRFKSKPFPPKEYYSTNTHMDIAVVVDRDVYIEAISTVSPYDDQHTQAAKFCFHRKVGSMKGLSSMRVGSPGI